MPVSFRSINEHSPLSIQEMRERRDTTTSEELTKLQTSLEFQTWRRSTIDWRFIGMMSVAGVLIALLTVLPTRYSRIEGDKVCSKSFLFLWEGRNFKITPSVARKSREERERHTHTDAYT